MWHEKCGSYYFFCNVTVLGTVLCIIGRAQAHRPLIMYSSIQRTSSRPPSTSPSHSCPRQIPALSRHSPTTFKLSSMLPWQRMKRRQKASFSPILLPPNYSPATPLPPFIPSFTVSSRNLITVAVAMRDYQTGSNRL